MTIARTASIAGLSLAVACGDGGMVAVGEDWRTRRKYVPVAATARPAIVDEVAVNVPSSRSCSRTVTPSMSISSRVEFPLAEASPRVWVAAKIRSPAAAWNE